MFSSINTWFKNQKIKTRLLVILILTSSITTCIIAFLGYSSGNSFIRESFDDKLAAIRENKSSQIESYFEFIRKQILTFSEDQMIIDAMTSFKEAFHSVKENLDGVDLETYAGSIKEYYENEYLKRLNPNLDQEKKVEDYWPDEDIATYFQYHYISNNSNPTGEKDNLEAAEDDIRYNKLHKKYHRIIQHYLKEFEYYDIFLIDDKTGHIVYSVFKEVDFATSLKYGPYKDTNFGKLFNKVSGIDNKNHVELIDFNTYDPSYSAPASFIATPIYNGEEKVGILMFQMPIGRINEILTGNESWENEGLGKTGEVYLLADDLKMRSMSRELIEDKSTYMSDLKAINYDPVFTNKIEKLETTIFLQTVNNNLLKQAFDKGLVSGETTNYLNKDVISTAKKINVKDVNWILVAEVEQSEAYSATRLLAWLFFLFIAILLGAVGFVANKISTGFTGPIRSLRDCIDHVIEGDKSVEIDIEAEDEIGDLARSFKLMLNDIADAEENLLEEKASVEKKVEEAVEEAEKQRSYLSDSVDTILVAMERFAKGELNVSLEIKTDDDIGNLYSGFNRAVDNVKNIIQKVSHVINQAASSSLEITSTTEELAATANEQTEQAVNIAAAMEQMSQTTIETSGNAKNTLSTAKKSGEIAKTGENVVVSTVGKIQDVARVVKESVNMMSNLSRSSSEIGNIISVINSIAEQTNLLALNAAIEAARAGEEGRGFAVVADEVRKLAERTRQATKQISSMIEEIQKEMNNAVEITSTGTSVVDDTIHLADDAGKSLKDILESSSELIEYINQISKANDEQTLTAKDIAKNIDQISSITKESAAAISDIAKSSNSLSQMNEELNEMIKFFNLD